MAQRRQTGGTLGLIAASTVIMIIVGLGFFFLTILISIWPPANRYSFVGLTSMSGKALMQQPTGALWPVLTAFAAVVLCTWAAVRVFEKQEL